MALRFYGIRRAYSPWRTARAGPARTSLGEKTSGVRQRPPFCNAPRRSRSLQRRSKESTLAELSPTHLGSTFYRRDRCVRPPVEKRDQGYLEREHPTRSQRHRCCPSRAGPQTAHAFGEKHRQGSRCRKCLDCLRGHNDAHAGPTVAVADRASGADMRPERV